MNAPLSAQEIQDSLAGLPGWTAEAGALARSFAFDDFRGAISFMVRVGFEAEALDHHPEWTNVYNRVSVRLSTHSAGGKVTAKDVELAAIIQRLFDKA
jgi:4a-hydroxytetrahydrobiopterin dehydratase